MQHFVDCLVMFLPIVVGWFWVFAATVFVIFKEHEKWKSWRNNRRRDREEKRQRIPNLERNLNGRINECERRCYALEDIERKRHQ